MKDVLLRSYLAVLLTILLLLVRASFGQAPGNGVIANVLSDPWNRPMDSKIAGQAEWVLARCGPSVLPIVSRVLDNPIGHPERVVGSSPGKEVPVRCKRRGCSR